MGYIKNIFNQLLRKSSLKVFTLAVRKKRCLKLGMGNSSERGKLNFQKKSIYIRGYVWNFCKV